jgi:hypothetical protein
MMTAEEFCIEWLPIVADREWHFGRQIRTGARCPVCEFVNEIQRMYFWSLGAGLILSVIPKLGLDPVISNAIYVIVVLIAILLLIGFLPQVGWWHRV